MFRSSNRPFLVAGIIAIIVTFLIFVHRHIDFQESIKESIIEAWATSMAAIFTALTVYLLYKQNQQQLDDRKAASQPDLYPEQFQLITKDESKNEVYTYSENKMFTLRPKFQNTTENPEKQYTYSFAVKLFNIGLGAAKQIKIKWLYDKKEVYEYVEGIYNLAKPNANVTELRSDGENLDFISPNNSALIIFPRYYVNCLGSSATKANNRNKHPQLKLEINFLDIYNTAILKTFDVKCTFQLDLVFLNFQQE